MTVAEMMAVIQNSHFKGVVVKKLWAQRNFRDWLKPHITRIPNIRDFRHFKIFRAVRNLTRAGRDYGADDY